MQDVAAVYGEAIGAPVDEMPVGKLEPAAGLLQRGSSQSHVRDHPQHEEPDRSRPLLEPHGQRLLLPALPAHLGGPLSEQKTRIHKHQLEQLLQLHERAK